MPKYILRRIGLAIITFFGITVLVFMISSMASGSPLELLLSNQNISPAEVERQRIKLGLDQPIYIQYFNWLKNFFQGNLGESYRTGQPVMEMIMNGLWPTVLLAFSSVIVACLIAFPLGIQSTRHQNRGWDNFSSLFSFLTTSTPSFFLALIFLYFFAVKLKLLPIGGMYESGQQGWDNFSSLFSFLTTSTPSFFLALIFLYFFAVKLKLLPIGGMYESGQQETLSSLLQHLFMPAVVLGMQMVGSLIQYTRSSMLEVMREDYVRTARSKGLKERVVIIKHVLRNSLIPVVTYLGMEIPLLIGGAVVTEQVFSWPGIGNLMIKSIDSRDYPVVMGITVLVAVAVLVFNILTDLIYGILDPRIRYD